MSSVTDLGTTTSSGYESHIYHAVKGVWHTTMWVWHMGGTLKSLFTVVTLQGSGRVYSQLL